MSELIIVGDRVLVEPADGASQTASGLYLPATVKEKEKVHSGRIVSVGPGYGVPNPEYAEDEPWAPTRPPIRYLPLQAQAGDFAFFLRDQAIEIEYKEETLVIVPHRAILALLRQQPDEKDIYDLPD